MMADSYGFYVKRNWQNSFFCGNEVLNRERVHQGSNDNSKLKSTEKTHNISEAILQLRSTTSAVNSV
jgi:hypothetical protein